MYIIIIRQVWRGSKGNKQGRREVGRSVEWGRMHDICNVRRRRGAGGSARRGGGAYIKHATVLPLHPHTTVRPLVNYYSFVSVYFYHINYLFQTNTLITVHCDCVRNHYETSLYCF